MRSSLKVAGGAVQGRSHEGHGLPCQDRYSLWRSKDKNAGGIALGDGAGSRSYSQIGAEFAVNAILEFVQEHFHEFFMNPALAKTKTIAFLIDGLNGIAKRNSLTLADLSTTLLFVCVQRKRKVLRYIAGHVGDGLIISGNGTKINLLSEPMRGEYANTTMFLTSKHIESVFRIYSGLLPTPASFIIMSDGAAESLYIRKSKTPNEVYCQQMLTWCVKYSQKKINKAILMNLERGIFRTVSADDCSIAILGVN